MIDFNKAEAYLLRQGLLMYQDGFMPVDSEKETILKILSHSKYYYTYTVDGKFYCGHYHHRAISDLFRIGKYYHNALTLENLYKYLIEYGKEKNVKSWICHQIHKRVYSHCNDGYHETNVFNTDETDEFYYEFPAIENNKPSYTYNYMLNDGSGMRYDPKEFYTNKENYQL